MTIDPSTLYIYYGIAADMAIILSALFAVLIYRRHKLKKLKEEQSLPLEDNGKEWPRLSIVVISQEHAVALEECLPTLLRQDYPNYEVVVVDAASTDDTDDVIKRLQKEHDNLRRTFVPAGGKVQDMNAMALMLGMRCARAEWCLVIFPDCSPETDEWLRRMARHINEDIDLVIGTATQKKLKNLCLRKQVLAQYHYSITQMERHAKNVREWSPQARIYQRD